MLSESDLERMRAVAAQILVDRCDILRKTVEPDNMGGETSTWAEIATDVPCAIAARGGAAEDDESSVIRGRSSLILTLPHDQDVHAEDRVRIQERTMEVLDVHLRTFQVTKRVELAEVT